MIEQKEPSSPFEELVFSEDALVDMPVIDDEIVLDKKEKKPSKRRRFLPFLGVYALLLLTACIGLLIGFSHYLTDYETSTPNAALDEYIKWVKTENYEAIYTAAGFTESVLNDKQDYLQYLQRVYEGTPHEITLRERPTTDDNKKQYSIYFDDKRVDILNLIPKQDNNGFVVVPQLAYQDECVIYAAPEMRITVNGQDISLLGVQATPKQNDVFYGLHDAAQYPVVNAYTLSGLLNPPTIEALTLTGEACTLISNPNRPNSYFVSPPCSAQQELETLATEAAFTYAKFIARDAGRNTLLKLIYKESELYDSIHNFSNAYFTKHDSYEFTNVKIHSQLRFTEQDFSCEVEFEPYYTTEGKTYQGETVHYRITLLNIDEKWQLIALKPVADNHTQTTTTDTNQATTTSTTM
jgi:hypothetical protein